MDYQKVWDLQRELVETKTERILICEHPVVITVGRGRESASDVLTSSLPVVPVERGGRATLHLPGQIVCYPIVNLKKRGMDQVQWLRLLEKVVIDLLGDFRVEAGVLENNTGVWVSGVRKIASLGVAVKNDMSYHGLAINVCCDLKLFQNLKPCGFSSEVMTSMKQEISPEYWKTWQLTDANLLARVRLRLAEVFEEDL